jgi:hypothetical protein
MFANLATGECFCTFTLPVVLNSCLNIYLTYLYLGAHVCQPGDGRVLLYFTCSPQFLFKYIPTLPIFRSTCLPTWRRYSASVLYLYYFRSTCLPIWRRESASGIRRWACPSRRRTITSGGSSSIRIPLGDRLF